MGVSISVGMDDFIYGLDLRLTKRCIFRASRNKHTHTHRQRQA